MVSFFKLLFPPCGVSYGLVKKNNLSIASRRVVIVVLYVFQTLSTLRSISLDQSYQQVENLAEKLEGLKQRFGLSSTQRLVHSVHLEMEKVG